MALNKHGAMESKQREVQKMRPGERMSIDGGSDGCKQARSRNSDSRENKKRGSVPPMIVSAFVMLMSKVQTVAAGSNQHGPFEEDCCQGTGKTSFDLERPLN